MILKPFLLEVEIGERAVAEGWLSESDWAACLEFLKQSPGVKASDHLVQRGLLSDAQVRILREQRLQDEASDRPVTMLCPSCAVVYQILEARPEDRFSCPSCRQPLVGGVREREVPADRVRDQSAAPGRPPEVEEALRDPGNVFRRFVKLSDLGSGGSGQVVRCYDQDLGRYIAVKFLPPGEEEGWERILRESRLVAKLDHPNIVRVHEAGAHRGVGYIVTDLIEGRNLAGATLEAALALQIMKAVADAVAAAHAAGVLHRDIKPSNIILDRAGKPWIVDFGTAKEMSGAADSAEGTIHGTPQFMSPEQARGKVSEITQRSDVYGLGATLYALVTGRPPFDGDEPMDVILAVREKEPPSPRKFVPLLSPQIEAIILKAMEKDPARRYPSARDLAEDIGRYLAGEAVLARRPGLLTLVRKTLVKRRIEAGLVLVLASLVGFLGYSAWDHTRHRELKARTLADAEAKFRLGRYEEALGDFDAALLHDPHDEIVRVRRLACLQQIQMRRDAQHRLIADLEQATSWLRQRFYRPDWKVPGISWIREAEARLIQQGPTAYGWALAGRYYQILGKASEARRAYNLGLALDRDQDDILFWKALLNLELSCVPILGSGGLDRLDSRSRRLVGEARSLLARGPQPGRRRLAPIDPDQGRLELDLARGYGLFLNDSAARALTFAEGMAEGYREKDFGEEFLLLGALASSSKAGATDKLDRAIERRPGYYWALCARAALGKPEEALADYEAILRGNPDFAPAYLGKARALSSLDRKDAEAAFRRAQELAPDWAEAHQALGAHLALSQRWAEARDEFTRAIQIEPEWYEAYAQRAAVWDGLQDPIAAAADRREALRLSPRDWTDRSRLEELLKR